MPSNGQGLAAPLAGRALIRLYGFLYSGEFHKHRRLAASATPRCWAAGLWEHRLFHRFK